MARRKLPNRRFVGTLDFQTFQRLGCNPIRYTASLGYYPDRKLGEVFLISGKAGTDLSIQAQEAAIAVSFALQYGCPIEEMRAAMPRTQDGDPEGAIGMLFDILSKEQV